MATNLMLASGVDMQTHMRAVIAGIVSGAVYPSNSVLAINGAVNFVRQRCLGSEIPFALHAGAIMFFDAIVLE